MGKGKDGKKMNNSKKGHTMRTIHIGSVFSLVLAVGMTDCLAEAECTITNVVRTREGRARSETITTVSHDVADYARRKKWMAEEGKVFDRIDNALVIADARAGYKGGEWSESWQKELVAWLKSQDLFKLRGAREFTDSKGFRHLISVGASNCEGAPGGGRPRDGVQSRVADRMARARAEMDAMSMLSLAWDADVERIKEGGTLKDGNRRESYRLERSTSTGTHTGIMTVYTCVAQAEEVEQVVFICVKGISPKFMNFNLSQTTSVQ